MSTPPQTNLKETRQHFGGKIVVYFPYKFVRVVLLFVLLSQKVGTYKSPSTQSLTHPHPHPLHFLSLVFSGLFRAQKV